MYNSVAEMIEINGREIKKKNGESHGIFARVQIDELPEVVNTDRRVLLCAVHLAQGQTDALGMVGASIEDILD